jgi:hypothetical protein
MGLTAVCPKEGCGYSAPSNSRRGGRLGNCPVDGTPLRAWTAGRAKGRYLCPVSGRVITLGLRRGIQLTEPMRAGFVPGWDQNYSERAPDPGRQGFWLPPGKYHRTEPTGSEKEDLDRAAGRVFGPGCVVSGYYIRRPAGDVWEGRAGVYLVPAPGADPVSWFVNERLKYRKCAGCDRRVPVIAGVNLMDHEWVPKRETYWKGRGRSSRQVPTDKGPHSAGTVACPDCRSGTQELVS